MFLCRTVKFWFVVLTFPRRGQSRLILHLLVLKPPRLTQARTEMMPKNLEKRVVLLCRLPPAVSEDGNLERKRKRARDVASTSTSVMKETSGEAAAAKDPEPDMFELLDS
jgi:hypothetical protein